MRPVLPTNALNGSAQLTEDTPSSVISAICVRDSGRFVLSQLAPPSFVTGRFVMFSERCPSICSRRRSTEQVLVKTRLAIGIHFLRERQAKNDKLRCRSSIFRTSVEPDRRMKASSRFVRRWRPRLASDSPCLAAPKIQTPILRNFVNRVGR